MTSELAYVYDHDDWAIHNVGRLWLEGLPDVNVTFVRESELTPEIVQQSSLIWFGYLRPFFRASVSGLVNTEQLAKCIVSIHDPIEVYPETSDWRADGAVLRPWWQYRSWTRWLALQLVREVPYVVTTSVEMREMLHAQRLDAHLIPTTSNLPVRAVSDISTADCSVLSVFNESPRKNRALLEDVRAMCVRELGIGFDTKIGRAVLPQSEYVELLDRHAVYICTSFQEGGPLPAIDAMQRGAVVVSTRVGQLPDLIVDGVTGYLCDSAEQFVDRIRSLASDLHHLQSMRVASLARIQTARSPEVIRSSVSALLTEALSSPSVRSRGTSARWSASLGIHWFVRQAHIARRRLAACWASA